MSEVLIKHPEKPEEYRAIMDVMKDAWGMEDYTEAVPAHFMISIADNGGLVLAAYLNEEIIGFALGIAARDDGKIYHYSHMVGVKRRYQDKGVGFKLKLAQREWAIKNNLDLIMWTFDPLQGRNAYFNFAKLGVICRKFYKNYYGEMRDELNRGMISDRFKVEWWIKSSRVIKKIKGDFPKPDFQKLLEKSEIIVESKEIKPGIRKIIGLNLECKKDIALIEIPGDINEVKKYSLELANDWRLKLRKVFEKYLSEKYIVTDLISLKNEGGFRRNYYILWRKDLNTILQGGLPWQ